MPQDDAKRILRQPRRSTTTGAGCLALFSLPFLGVGVGVVLLAAGVIPADEANFNVPRWVVGAVGGLFALAGFWMLISSLRAWAGKRAAARRAAERPHEPWFADFAWDPEGARDAPWRHVAKSLAGTLVFAAFAAPFNYVGFVEGDLVFGIVAVVLDLVVLGVFAYAVYAAARAAKYGGSRLRYSRFPFFLGETLEAEFRNPRGLGRFRNLALTLRCIEERVEQRHRGNHRTEQIVPYEIYNDTVRFEEGGEYGPGDQALPIAFPLPADRPATALASNPARYWEVEIVAETAGVDFSTRFLVPVYARPETGGEAPS
jgi:hypothetical protein